MADEKAEIVKQSNELINLTVERWPLHEKRIMLSLAAAMRDDDPPETEYRLDARELILATGGSRSEYSRIKEGAESLLSRQVYRVNRLPDGRRHFIGINLLSKIEYQEGQATIIARPTIDGRAFFIGLQRFFTLIPLEEALALSNFPAVRLFELLAQFRSTGWRQIGMEEIHGLLGLVELDDKKRRARRVKYPTAGSLFKHVIRPAADEITQKTSLKIDDIEQIKRRPPESEAPQGKKTRARVTAFRFRFHLEETDPRPLWPGRKHRPEEKKMGPLFAATPPTAPPPLPDAAEQTEAARKESAAVQAERKQILEALAGLDDETRGFLLERAERRLRAGGVQFIARPQVEALAVELLKSENL